jgi:hypothetical protein
MGEKIYQWSPCSSQPTDAVGDGGILCAAARPERTATAAEETTNFMLRVVTDLGVENRDIVRSDRPLYAVKPVAECPIRRVTLLGRF